MNRNECFDPSGVSAIAAHLAWASVEMVADDTADLQVLVSGGDQDVADLRIGVADSVLTVEQPSYGLSPRINSAHWMQVVIRVPRRWKGAVDAVTITGQMKARGLTGSDLIFATVTGCLQALDLNGLTAEFRTVSGTLSATGLTAEKISIRTVTGDISFTGVDTVRLRYTTVNGDVSLFFAAPFEKAEGSSVSGAVTLTVQNPETRVNFRTVAGKLRTEGIAQTEAGSELIATSVTGGLTVLSGLKQLAASGS